jgi:hypothetical protein
MKVRYDLVRDETGKQEDMLEEMCETLNSDEQNFPCTPFNIDASLNYKPVTLFIEIDDCFDEPTRNEILARAKMAVAYWDAGWNCHANA